MEVHQEDGLKSIAACQDVSCLNYLVAGPGQAGRLYRQI